MNTKIDEENTQGFFSLSFFADAKTRKEKLEQVASFSLFGNIMSMASVQLIGANRDALLLSFKDAKVATLQAFQMSCERFRVTDYAACSLSPVGCSGV